MHIPKTGGTTFKKIVINRLRLKHFRDSKDRYNINKSSWYMDYYDKKIKFRPKLPKCNLDKYDVVSGHFKASKYLFLNRPMITWVRNPTDRLISQYYNWKYKCDHIDNYKDKDELVWYDSFKNGMDIVEFSKAFGNHMSFFFDIQPIKFKFIGILEQYQKSLNLFLNIMNINISINSSIFNNFEHPKVNNNIRKEICKNQKDDFDLYNECLSIFKNY